MKILIRIVWLFIIWISVTESVVAQEFIVISCNGEVNHVVSHDSTMYKVIAGDKIEAKGKLVLEKNATIKLICNERPQSFAEVDEVNLENLYSEVTTQSISFTGRFWNFIVEGLKSSDSDKDLKKYHSEFLNIKGSIKGYSEANSVIRIISPVGPIISDDQFKLKWTSQIDSLSYRVHIMKQENRELIKTYRPTIMGMTISLDKLLLQQDENYYLRIVDNKRNYSEILFQYKEVDEESIDRKLNSIIGYQESSDKEKAWMRATVLEMQGYVMEANSLFIGLLKEYPGDNYIQKLYLLFQTRTNQLENL